MVDATGTAAAAGIVAAVAAVAAVQAAARVAPAAARGDPRAAIVLAAASRWDPAADATATGAVAVQRTRWAVRAGWSRAHLAVPIVPVVAAIAIAVAAHAHRVDPGAARVRREHLHVALAAVALAAVALAAVALAAAVAPGAAPVVDPGAVLAAVDPGAVPAVDRGAVPVVVRRVITRARVAPVVAVAVAVVVVAARAAASAVRGAIAAGSGPAVVVVVRGARGRRATRRDGRWLNQFRPTPFPALRLRRPRRSPTSPKPSRPSPKTSSPALASTSARRHQRRCNVTETPSEVALARNLAVAWRLLLFVPGIRRARIAGGSCAGSGR